MLSQKCSHSLNFLIVLIASFSAISILVPPSVVTFFRNSLAADLLVADEVVMIISLSPGNHVVTLLLNMIMAKWS